MDRNVRAALHRILDYLDEERRDFLDSPRPGHIWESAEIVDEWLRDIEGTKPVITIP